MGGDTVTQKPNKPIKARAMGVGVTEKVWQALEAAGLVIVDKAKLERLLAQLKELEAKP